MLFNKVLCSLFPKLIDLSQQNELNTTREFELNQLIHKFKQDQASYLEALGNTRFASAESKQIIKDLVDEQKQFILDLSKSAEFYLGAPPLHYEIIALDSFESGQLSFQFFLAIQKPIKEYALTDEEQRYFMALRQFYHVAFCLACESDFLIEARVDHVLRQGLEINLQHAKEPIGILAMGSPESLVYMLSRSEHNNTNAAVSNVIKLIGCQTVYSSYDICGDDRNPLQTRIQTAIHDLLNKRIPHQYLLLACEPKEPLETRHVLIWRDNIRNRWAWCLASDVTTHSVVPYEWNLKHRTLLLLGTHENFYRNLKR